MKKIYPPVLVLLLIASGFYACKKAKENNSLNASNKSSSELNTLLACNYVTLYGPLSTQTLSSANVYLISGLVKIPTVECPFIKPYFFGILADAPLSAKSFSTLNLGTLVAFIY